MLIAGSVLAVAAYGAWPIYAVSQLHGAIVRGDAGYLKDKVAWQDFRTSFKDALREQVFLKVMQDLETPRESAWATRLLAMELAGHLLDQLVERNVTPSNFRNVVRTGSLFRDLGLHNRKLRPGVVKRLSFTGARTFSVELGKPADPSATLIVTLALVDFDWKLSGFQILEEIGDQSPDLLVDGPTETAARVSQRPLLQVAVRGCGTGVSLQTPVGLCYAGARTGRPAWRQVR